MSAACSFGLQLLTRYILQSALVDGRRTAARPGTDQALPQRGGPVPGGEGAASAAPSPRQRAEPRALQPQHHQAVRAGAVPRLMAFSARAPRTAVCAMHIVFRKHNLALHGSVHAV